MKKTPLLSICIPTYNRAYFLKKTLLSIVNDDIFINTKDVEVIVSDNDSTDKTKEIVKIFIDKFGDKIKYFKNETNLLDKNTELSLKKGSGELLKLQNDTLIFRKGSLEKILKIIKDNQEKKPNIYFLNSSKANLPILSYYENSDDFITALSYSSTWIGGFAIWKQDLSFIKDFARKFETKLPQVDALFRMIAQKKNSCICNMKLFDSLLVPSKGGYNIAEIFGQNYLGLLKEALDDNLISQKTYNQQKKLILIKHINHFYFDLKENYNFDKNGYFKYLKEYKKNFYFWQSFCSYKLKQLRLKIQKKISKTRFIRKSWRKRNKHNQLSIAVKTPLSNLKKIIVGNGSYGSIVPVFFGAKNESLIIGNYVSIAKNVKFILGGNHLYKGFSTYPFKVKFLGEKIEAQSKGTIIVEDDAWIGDSATILSGVTIGKGAIVAACSVVTKDVSPYAIVAGNPARVIKHRFSEKIIEKMQFFDFNNLTKESISDNKDILYTELNEDNIDEILKSLS